MSDLSPQRKTSGPAIASLVLGILSLICLGLLAGIPAIICGHVARGQIRRSPVLIEGGGLALAGLIMGYLSTVTTAIVVAVIAAVALPAVTFAREGSHAAQDLANARQIQSAIQAMAADNPAGQGFPADAGITTTTELKERLVQGGYLSAGDIESLRLEDFFIGNVSSSDPDGTILVRSNPEKTKRRFQIVVRKGGDGDLILPSQPLIGSDPPRDPPYLSP